MTDTPWDRQREALGSFIRSQRELASLSLRQLSDLAQVSNAYLSQIERGLHEPSLRVIKNVAEALGLAPELLLEQVGLLDEGHEDSRPSSTEGAIQSDPMLTEDEKVALLSVYRSFVAERD